MVVPEEREGKQAEVSGILTRDSRQAKEDAISTRKGGQHQKEKHQVLYNMSWNTIILSPVALRFIIPLVLQTLQFLFMDTILVLCIQV